MMHNRQPYSFEKTDVRGRFLLKFSCTNVKLETVSPIAGNLPIKLDSTLEFVIGEIVNWIDYYAYYEGEKAGINAVREILGINEIIDKLISGK